MATTTTTDAGAQQAPAKYSRYRSVRKANRTETAPAPIPASTSTSTSTSATAPVPASASTSSATDNKPQQNGMAQRSMSRYRRPRAPTAAQDVHSPPITPAIPQDNITTSTRHRNDNNDRRQRPTTPPQPPPPRSPSPPPTPLSPREEEARLRRAHERTRAQRQARQKADEEEARRILDEQKRKDLERLEATLAAAVAVAAPGSGSGSGSGPMSPPPVPAGKFKIFGRKRSATRVAQAKEETGRGERGASEDVGGRKGEVVGVGGVGMDAPVSAVNAGERRVLIRFKQASINLPITPTTTAQELIYSATNVLSQSVAPDAAILCESYASAGLERRIRRYEHIRDIMNSWDRDTQNALVLISSDSPRHDNDLWPHTAPRRRPEQFSAQLHHSHKPGRWTKSHITLLPSGQLYAHRKPGAKLSERDSSPLCHLSDFDVYTPTPQQARKLQPPRKHSCAIKSQQKATMFLSAENFVHFFCTDDAAASDAFQTAVQRWRSWYLLSTTSQAATTTNSASPKSTPYTLGSFEPLSLSLSLSSPHSSTPSSRTTTITSPTEPFQDSSTTTTTTSSSNTRQIPFHLRHSLLPALNTHPHPHSRTTPHPTSPDPDSSEPAFSASSLLGNTYTARARAATLRDGGGGGANPDFAAGPFIPGPSLLNSAGATDSSLPTTTTTISESKATASAATTSKISRALSTRSRAGTMTGGAANGTAGPGATSGTADPPPPVPGIPAPLLEFKNEFVEAPQWRGEGRGRGVEAPRGVLLVDIAGSGSGAGIGMGGGGLERKGTVFRR